MQYVVGNSFFENVLIYVQYCDKMMKKERDGLWVMRIMYLFKCAVILLITAPILAVNWFVPIGKMGKRPIPWSVLAWWIVMIFPKSFLPLRWEKPLWRAVLPRSFGSGRKKAIVLMNCRRTFGIHGRMLLSFIIFANANAGGKKIRYINNVCEHLKTNHTILCDDKLLREVVTKVYEKISYYEKMEYDFSDIHPCCLPWHARHFQSRMQGKFWFISQTKKDYSFSLSYESVFFFGDFNLYYIYCLPIAYFG